MDIKPQLQGEGEEPSRKKVKLEEEQEGQDQSQNPKDEGKEFPCGKCPLSFSNQREQRSHWYKSHDKYLPPSKNPPRPCPVCQQLFPAGREMEDHKRQEHGFKCPTCGKAFFKKVGLDDHMKTTHGENLSFICSFCGICVEKERDLTEHVQTSHANEPGAKLRCSICNFATFSQFIHEQHMGKHKSSKCNVCGLEFATKTSLRKHRNSSGHKA